MTVDHVGVATTHVETMVEVVSSNFAAVFPRVEECVQRCEFVAIDTEFTGLHASSDDQPSLFDSVDGYYQKYCRFAHTYSIVQFGLSAFIKDPSSNKYDAHTFNFYLFPKDKYSKDGRINFQVGNVEFLCQYNFDFNKLFYQGIHYMSHQQEQELTKSSKEISDAEREEAVGFSRVIWLLERSQKPILGHNMMSDLCLMYDKFYQPLPASLSEFKQKLHQLFPLIVDTKHMCRAAAKMLSRSHLLQFSSLTDLFEALGSQRGTFYALCAPAICHAEDSAKYDVEKCPHQAGFDAFCVGFVFLRMAHLMAMRGLESSEARPVHIQQYLRLVKPHSNRVNLIRGPLSHINLEGSDPASQRSDWLVITTRSRAPISLEQLQRELEFSAMDVQLTAPHKAIAVLATRHRAQRLLSMQSEHFVVRPHQWWRDSPAPRRLLWVWLPCAVAVLGTVLTLRVLRAKS